MQDKVDRLEVEVIERCLFDDPGESRCDTRTDQYVCDLVCISEVKWDDSEIAELRRLMDLLKFCFRT